MKAFVLTVLGSLLAMQCPAQLPGKPQFEALEWEPVREFQNKPPPASITRNAEGIVVTHSPIRTTKPLPLPFRVVFEVKLAQETINYGVFGINILSPGTETYSDPNKAIFDVALNSSRGSWLTLSATRRQKRDALWGKEIRRNTSLKPGNSCRVTIQVQPKTILLALNDRQTSYKADFDIPENCMLEVRAYGAETQWLLLRTVREKPQ